MQAPRPTRFSGTRMRHFSDSFEDLAARNASHMASRSPMALAGAQMLADRASAKDAESAAQLVALLKTEGRALLAAEAGALRCTIVPPGAIGMVAAWRSARDG